MAIKILPYTNELQTHIDEEYRIYRDYSSHPNLPDFFGVYRKSAANGISEIWFILEVTIL